VFYITVYWRNIYDVPGAFFELYAKKSPEVANTEALIKKAVTLYGELGVRSEVVRSVDYAVGFGVYSDIGEGDP
jgi:hypothetical protein